MSLGIADLRGVVVVTGDRVQRSGARRMRVAMNSKRRARAGWAVALTLLCTLLLTSIVVQADDSGVDPAPVTGESMERARDQLVLESALASPGLRLTPSKVSLAEGGGPVSYEAILRKRPSAPVVVSVTPDSQTAVSPGVLVFSPAEWNLPQEVAVWAEDDDLAEGLHNGIVTHYMASTGSDYTGLDPVELTATIEDNDNQGIQVKPVSLTVSEPQGSAEVTYSLVSAPDDSVTIPLTTSNDECSVAPPSVVLDSENWEDGAKATVSARDDNLDDGDQTCVVRGGPSSSTDPGYQGLRPPDVTVVVLDDDELWRALLPAAFHHWPPLPETPVLEAIDNADGDGAYPVRWSPALRAETYVLEEAKKPGFVSALERYSGPATEFSVADQGAGRLYYRVKGQNNWGGSPWSVAQMVDVLWEAEPNQDASSLTNGPLASGLVYYGTFPDDQDTKDYYYFDLAGQGTVRLWLQNIPDGQNYDLVLRDAALETQPGWYSAGLGSQDEYIEATIPAGRYHIQIHNAGGRGSSQPYHLRVQY
jgi:hypothetical protein